ncbi:hypothetical protein B6R96_32195 [Streptomyces sp. Sge12]|nr:hypothetical protein B6R96_32195 [Streptomyces sp. Sge12]
MAAEILCAPWSAPAGWARDDHPPKGRCRVAGPAPCAPHEEPTPVGGHPPGRANSRPWTGCRPPRAPRSSGRPPAATTRSGTCCGATAPSCTAPAPACGRPAPSARLRSARSTTSPWSGTSSPTRTGPCRPGPGARWAAYCGSWTRSSAGGRCSTGTPPPPTGRGAHARGGTGGCTRTSERGRRER